MRILVLCVDRDDDMGEKASIISPIIGRETNLDAAVALALKDPEDSDVNTTLAGVRIYDGLLLDGVEAEVVTICGDKRVGKRSDEVIATQLDIVLKEIEPTGVILVTDGAEDEFIIPLVSSRTIVNSVERVVVKQGKSIEDTYYLITRLMNDEKIQKRFLLPLAILLLFWGLSSILAASFNFPDIGVPTILFMVGMFLIIRIFHLEEGVVRFARDFRRGVEKGYISTFMGIIAVILVIYAILSTALKVMDSPQYNLMQITLVILGDSLWLIIAAGGFYTLGRLFDIYLRKGYLVSSIVLSLFILLAGGAVIHASLQVLNYVVGLSDSIDPVEIFGSLIGGFLIFLLGRAIYRYARSPTKRKTMARY